MQLGQFLKLINSVTSFLFWNLFIRSKLNCVYKINMDPTLAKLFNRQNNQSTLYFLRVFMRVSYRIGLLLDYSEWNHRSSCMCMHFAITPDYASHRVASPLRAIPLADSTTSRAVHGAFSIRRYSVGDKIFTRHTHRDTHTHTHTHIYIYIYHICIHDEINYYMFLEWTPVYNRQSFAFIPSTCCLTVIWYDRLYAKLRTHLFLS